MDSTFLFPILLVLLGGFMYMSVRKQKKRAAEVQDMQNSVSTGARVQLTSGLFGTVIDANRDHVDVEIAPGVVTRWNKLAIREVVPTEDAAATYAGALLGDEDADTESTLDTPDTPAVESDSTTDKPSDDK